VKETNLVVGADVSRQRTLVDAFLAATRSGDLDAIVALLDPNVILRADAGPGASEVIRGARKVGKQALFFSELVEVLRPVLVNGLAGLASWRSDGMAFSILAFTVNQDAIVEIDVLADPARLQRLDLPAVH
jgi:hypothetical protein